MQRRQILKHLATAFPALALSRYSQAATTPDIAGQIASGPFAPDWNSLATYRTPDWFRNAKFGIWAHWGPQCQPAYGDWYGRIMYEEGSDFYRYHVQKYGHPSQFGFKDVIPQWKADKWDPDALVALYQKAGAKYFVALANHHDNFDLYDSKYQPQWNSTQIGPKQDLIAGWSKAARKHGLRFGVSVHASHAWTWYETAQGADKSGPLAGVQYDGKLLKEDGKGKWWDGLDPQALYAQQHPRSKDNGNGGVADQQWGWGGGVSVPDRAYCEKFYSRTMELINNYDPDLVYFDDNVLPLWPISDVGLRLAANIYNKSMAKNGKLDVVINGKVLDIRQRQCMVWDIERGQSNQIEPLPWQTCTCIGSWHYDQRIYDNKSYKSAKTVVHMLIDVVSKNGNLLLSVPVRGDGSIDEQERAIVEEIGDWVAINGEGIYGTRPWLVFGEGPAMEGAALSAQGFNEGKSKPFTHVDIRFTSKGDAVYAFVLGWPEDGNVLIKTMRRGNPQVAQRISSVQLVGEGRALAFRQTAEGLHVMLPPDQPKQSYAVALKIV